MSLPTAKIICDSISPDGIRLTTMECKFHRMILAEVNTHRQFCLDGDSELYFDLPLSCKKNKHSVFKMKLSEFYKKWNFGKKSRKNNPASINLGKLKNINIQKEYSIPELKEKINYHFGYAIRKGKIKARLEQQECLRYWISGKDILQYFANAENFINKQPAKDGLKRMFIRQLNEETGKYTHTNITDCWSSGIKECFKVTTLSGNFIIGSKDHRILTNNGWKTISELDINNDKLAGRNVEFYKSSSHKVNGKWVNQWNLKVLPEVKEKQFNKCFFCQQKIKLEIHHLIPVYKDNTKAFEKDNVVGVCNSCHKNQHKKQGWQKGQQLLLQWETIDSIVPVGKKETYDISVDGQFSNFVANGLVVHNSRNSASSRAIPVSKMLERVETDPAMPLFFGKNQAGMAAAVELDTDEKQMAINTWLIARDNAVSSVKKLQAIGLHKQLTNRLLEPWLWHTAIISATEWDNFFGQRSAINPETNQPYAMPEMYALEQAMEKAYYEGTPKLVGYGEWHLPYIQEEDWVWANKQLQLFDDSVELWEILKKISAGRVARVSYLTHDGKRDPLEDIKLAEKLISAKPMHPSPFEAQATPSICYPLNNSKGNFRGWTQYRHSFENENVKNFKSRFLFPIINKT
jgi:hypothetical protein